MVKKGLFECLLDDIKSPQLSLSFRSSLETIVQTATTGQLLLDQVLSSNLVRVISDSCYFNRDLYRLEQLKNLSNVVNSMLDLLPPNAKPNVISYIYLNMRRLNPQCRNELLKNKIFDMSTTDSTKKQLDSGPWDETSPMEFTTPTSPPHSSSQMNSLFCFPKKDYVYFSICQISQFKMNFNQIFSSNKKEIGENLSFVKLSLQTCDPIMLKNCISKYNMSLTGSQPSLRHFWPKWQQNVSRHISSNNEPNNSLINATYLKLTNVNDMDYFFITFAKINQLIQIKVYFKFSLFLFF